MVGAAVATPGEGEQAEQADDKGTPVPFTAPPGTRTPFFDEPFDEEQDVLSALSSKRSDPYGLDEAGVGPSFSAIFDDPDLAGLVRALETELPHGEPKELVQHARHVFEQILADGDAFPGDMPIESRVAMLGVSLRRYAHFQRLLSASTLDRVDCAFILHFLTDLQLGKTIG
jgi:hypothetical protein